MRSPLMSNRGWTGSAVLLVALAVTAGGLVAWKRASVRKADAAAASQPEPIESVTMAVAKARQYRPTTTSVGTILALTSITLRNELAGTVRQALLVPGQVVESGTVLVALDVSVEQAELNAEQAQADLAQTTLARLERLREAQATSQEEVDQARAGRDVALSEDAAGYEVGDLLFFAGGMRVDHVAIWAGAGRVVHAALSRGGVVADDYFGETPIGRRLRKEIVAVRRVYLSPQ